MVDVVQQIVVSHVGDFSLFLMRTEMHMWVEHKVEEFIERASRNTWQEEPQLFSPHSLFHSSPWYRLLDELTVMVKFKY